MKALRALFTVVTLGLLIAFSGCGPKGGSTETVQDKQLGLLSKTWKISDVKYGSVDSLARFQTSGFKITISGTKGQTSFNYTCVNKPASTVWPASGQFTFDATNPTTLVTRTPDNLQITYSVDPASTKLTLSFTYPNGGTIYRTSNLSGSWEFDFVPAP